MFAKWWLGPYVVTSANNTTYHLVELNRTRLATPIAKKKVKIFKKQHEREPIIKELAKNEDGDELGSRNEK